ncbi:hypothetical protein HJFPF1_13422 [Paramyrothecium foliicola]|nr:hypothetical protein HJFPF1_13422 [Paramyrothecium foliicola]
MVTVPSFPPQEREKPGRTADLLAATPEAFVPSGQSPDTPGVLESLSSAGLTTSLSPSWASESPEGEGPISTIPILVSPLSPTFFPFPTATSDLVSPHSAAAELQEDIMAHRSVIDYFKKNLSRCLTIQIDGIVNPFTDYVLPLAYQQRGILDALIGLSACHMFISGNNDSQHLMTVSLQSRVSALRSVGSLLLKEEVLGLTATEEECLLCTVLLLVCETGVSSHGAHVSGVSFLCKRLVRPENFFKCSEASRFFVFALAWLDILRGFSGAEKLVYSNAVRECVRDHASLGLYTLIGCPPDLFHRIGQVLESAKAFMAGDLAIDQFQVQLDEAEAFLEAWDPDEAAFPTAHPEWRHLAEAYRHACLLRVHRFPDSFAVSCEDVRIKTSVSAILDVCAVVPRDSVFYKRLLFPLFLAGADTCSPHQIHYVSWCIGEIKHATGFQHPAMTEMLTKVWEERRSNPSNLPNVPWMEFVCFFNLPAALRHNITVKNYGRTSQSH